MTNPDSSKFSAKDVNFSAESENRPEKLYRAFSVNPDKLTIEMLSETLTPGDIAKADPALAENENELGTYMTTNERMAFEAYAQGGDIGIIKTPRHMDNGGLVDFVVLPTCGIEVEVTTASLPIRRPKIAPQWQGHYNNGYEGDEWIANEIPKENYRVIKIILAKAHGDRNMTEIEIKSPQDLEPAVAQIKQLYDKAKIEAMVYKDFLETLPEKVRTNEYLLKRAWKSRQEE